MKELITFFTSPEMRKILDEYKRNIQSSNGQLSLYRDIKIKNLAIIINDMLNYGDNWNLYCQDSIKKIGNKFATELDKCENFGLEENIDFKYAMAFEFLMEYHMKSSENLHQELETARTFVIEEFDSFNERAKINIRSVIFGHPVNVVRDLLNKKNLKIIQEYINKLTTHEEREKKWAIELQEKENIVNRLKNNLDKYEQAFNFVGLFQGFDELSTRKENERKILLKWMLVLAFLSLFPLIIEIIFVFNNFEKFEEVKKLLIMIFFPTISFIVIIMYYFKIILTNYKSIKSQLVQIELRKTLCRFIQHYGDYASKMRVKDDTSLAKFENIIFSHIVANEEKIPSPYDGLEQIFRAIKTAKS